MADYMMIGAAFICEGCGQLTTTTREGLCPKCREGQYGGGEKHEPDRLFKPAPEQMPGQLDLEGEE